MKYAIITPTYKPHFQYIDKYLRSYEKYVVDKDKIDLVFTISHSEVKDFYKVAKKHQKSTKFKLLFIEDVLADFGIFESSEKLLNKYKKFTFQTLKKYYTMLYVGADYSLVLDSETMWIRNTKMVDLFENFYKAPFITYSDISTRHKTAPLLKNVVHNINYLLENALKRQKENMVEVIEYISSEGFDISQEKSNENIFTPFNIWCLENFMWFYDKKILEDMFEQLGSPIELANYIKNLEKKKTKDNAKKLKYKKLADTGIFEINLYQTFIFANNDKYNYSLINANDIIKDSMSTQDAKNYLSEFFALYNGRCGILERVIPLLKPSHYRKIAQKFKQHNFSIIRGDIGTFNKKNIAIAKDFLDIVQPNILAASQEHLFGVNATIFNRCKIIFRNSKYIIKIKKHWDYFFAPINIILKPFKILFKFINKFLVWLTQPIAFILYVLKLFIELLKNLRLILLG